MLKEKLRITQLQLIEFKPPSLMCYLVGKGILSSTKNLIREDDITNGDIVFYEESK